MRLGVGSAGNSQRDPDKRTRIEGLPDEPGSIRKRLAEVDKLLSGGVISAEEHAMQRARILGEL
jgi:hypothetical protein